MRRDASMTSSSHEVCEL